jgi:signal transduction histidine kinase
MAGVDVDPQPIRDGADGASPAPSSVAGLSALDLDDLLEELRARAGSARAAHQRLTALLDAVVAVSSDLELSAVLRRIVQAACELVDAKYGALGVLGPEGEELIEFVTHGVTEEERAAIGPLPHGRGLLGLIIRSPHPQRVPRIAEHPDSYGFPPNHPVMTSFLGAPVRTRNEVFGNLYMTDKRSATEFSPDDEAILTALAAAAGVAIDNARLYQRNHVQLRWGEATRDLVSALLQGRSEEDVLADATRNVVELTGAEACVIAQPDGPDLVVVAAAGPKAPAVGTVVTNPQWRVELAAKPATAEREWSAADALLPIGVGGKESLGVLSIEGMDVLPGGNHPPLTDFAQRLAVGLTAAKAQREQARVDLLEDRDRIARDMHDHVIQRLFATGLSLQSSGRLVGEPVARERIEAAVDEVDAVIKDIRHTIFALHRAPGSRTLGSEVSAVCEAAVVTLGFAPSLTIRGSLADVSDQVAADLIAVVREGLSNAARHAKATEVAVVVEAGDALRVVVRDNGRGIPREARRSGLDNLARRAATRGGSFDLAPGEGGGTVLVWTVPTGSF